MKTPTSDMDSLLRFSAHIGRDPLLVQASSGNTSFKRDGTLWIKASGKWLASADQQQFFIPVSLSECLNCLKQGRELPTNDGSSCTECLRPSIETFMHAVLPQRFVIHVHSVDALAWAVRADAESLISRKLSGMSWRWIPYVPSGLPLAREIQLASSTRPNTDVFILGNHGLVVCGESCEAAESVLSEVQRRLATRPRTAAKPNIRVLGRLQGLSSWRLSDCDVLHTLGTDRISCEVVKRGVLYPCQAIFLGERLTVMKASADESNVGSRIDGFAASSPFIIVEGSGILIHSAIKSGELAVLRGLAEVVRRIDPSAPIRYLSDCEVNTVLRTDADRYRMSAENGVDSASPARASAREVPFP